MEKIQFLYKTFQRLKKRVLKEDKIREYINNYRVGKLSQIRKKALFSKKKLTNMTTLKLRILFISGDHKVKTIQATGFSSCVLFCFAVLD